MNGPSETSYLLMENKRIHKVHSKVLRDIEGYQIVNINPWAASAMFFKAAFCSLSFVGMRFLLKHLGHESNTPISSVTAFMAGTYFVLSILFKGILDEYSECARMPTRITSEVVQYREIWELFGTRDEVFQVSKILSDFVEKVIMGIRNPKHGITGLDSILDDFEDLHDMQVSLVQDPESHKQHPNMNPMTVASSLSKQLNVIRAHILRADHVSRCNYLPVGAAFNWIISICCTMVLLSVTTTDIIQELTLLPSLVLFVYLFVMFMTEMDDPFDINSSISVSIESLEKLHSTTRQWLEEFDRRSS
uniref:Bestrophin homolog n=1 Tax=Lotharella oceanica TaxID=641309 RepID=A0A7S2TI20_9EUKA|mmetsp:Transcript_15129/g.28791  ORF Transcript_15129/g.28791 Transcript_15129/m.28791 type:complete len:305 (+) Transcript_15129:41-955(+)